MSAIVDVQHQILAARQIECLFCGWPERLAWFGRWISDRGGLTIVHCRCQHCERSWRRIECED